MVHSTWSRDELIVAFNLYCKTPFTKINAGNKDVVRLARTIGRSASAVALKLANFARLDPALRVRNIAGMRHGSKGEEEIWNDFSRNWEGLAFESERILATYERTSLDVFGGILTSDLPTDGKEREAVVRIRINQAFFRKAVLASYDNHCCVTGISMPELLVASHIVPWSVDQKNRMNPSNGLCLNALHDRAFDNGLMTITPDYSIKISTRLISESRNPNLVSFFSAYQGRKIQLPQRFLPTREFLERHNQEIFRQ